MKKGNFTINLFLILSFLVFTHLSIHAQTVQLATDPVLGQILTDDEGNTLYYFTKDAEPNTSFCIDGCSLAWPTFHMASSTMDAGLDEADFGEFQRADGDMQSTYKGWPLYYFNNDVSAGDTNGEGANNVWYVAKPDYSIMLMNDNLVGADGNTYDGNYELGTEEVQYFTDAYGRTLYTFVNDNFDENNFTAEDFSNNGAWPVYEENFQQIPSDLDPSLFNTIDVFGRNQMTYKGWPLYYFGQDAERGETKGVSVPMPGVWPVAEQDLEEAIVSVIEEIESLTEFHIFPNPIANGVNISFDLNTNTELRFSLLNSIGQEILILKNDEFFTGNNFVYFDQLDDLVKGVYFLKIQTPEGRINISQVIKQ